MTPFQKLLVKLEDCEDIRICSGDKPLREACEDFRRWAGDKPLREAWSDCQKADWMLGLAGWMAGQPGWPTHPQVVMAASAIARKALPHAGRVHPHALSLIQAAEAWAADPSPEKRDVAEDAAVEARGDAEKALWEELLEGRAGEEWAAVEAAAEVTEVAVWASQEDPYWVARKAFEVVVWAGLAAAAPPEVARALEAEHAEICRNMLAVPQILEGEGETNQEEEEHQKP